MSRLGSGFLLGLIGVCPAMAETTDRAGGAARIAWGTAETIAVITTVIALLSLAFSIIQYLRARHENVIRALQGNKETVGYIAFRLSEGNRRLLRNPRRRREILMALCLAAVFEKSGRSRTLIYRALEKAKKTYEDEVIGLVDEIETHFDDYEKISKLEKGRKRLGQLRQALSIERAAPVEAP